MKMKERIEKVFKEVFDDDKFILELQLTSNQMPEWDSMTHIQLILALEQEFSIKFNTQEIANMDTVEKIMSIVQGKVR